MTAMRAADADDRLDNWTLILGPPGTGKTSRLLRTLEWEMGSMSPKEIAFVSFTRAARDEARRRAAKALRCVPDDLVWFRTIHSMAFKLLGLGRGDLVTPTDMEEFSKRYGYEFSTMRELREDADDHDIDVKSPDDALLATLSWGRNRRLSHTEAPRRSPFNVHPAHFEKFVERYNGMRAEKERYDFHDLLEKAMADDTRPPVRVAFIDEAQDLSPLQVHLVERWFWSCERVYVAGDDDQAIFSFLGGDPDWLVSLSKRCRVEVLEESFRVPALVHDMARLAIAENRNRVPKVYHPKNESGELHVVDRQTAIDLIDETEQTFVLGRNWRVIRGFARLLRQRGLAFVVERHPSWSPLGASGNGPIIKAWKAVLELQAGNAIPPRMCDSIFDMIPAGRHGENLLPRGAKKRGKENKSPLNLETLRAWGLTYLAAAIERVGPEVLLKVSGRLRRELEAITRRYGELPNPKIKLVSIHSSKGQEAPTVIILPEITRATNVALTQRGTAETEAENRLAYVAITRAMRRLLVCKSESERYYPYERLASRAKVPERTEDDWWFGD